MGGARVDRDDDAVLEDETERGGAVIGLDVIATTSRWNSSYCGWMGGVVWSGRGSDLGARVQTVLGGNPRRKIDVARGAPGVYPGGRTHVLDHGQLEVLRVNVAVDLSRAAWVGSGMARSGEARGRSTTEQAERGQARLGQICPTRGRERAMATGRAGGCAPVGLYPVRRALRRVQHGVIELEGRHRARAPLSARVRAVYGRPVTKST